MALPKIAVADLWSSNHSFGQRPSILHALHLSRRLIVNAQPDCTEYSHPLLRRDPLVCRHVQFSELFCAGYLDLEKKRKRKIIIQVYKQLDLKKVAVATNLLHNPSSDVHFQGRVEAVVAYKMNGLQFHEVFHPSSPLQDWNCL
jgi:hypothetical protein